MFARRLRLIGFASRVRLTAMASSLLLFGPHVELVMKAAGTPKM